MDHPCEILSLITYLITAILCENTTSTYLIKIWWINLLTILAEYRYYLIQVLLVFSASNSWTWQDFIPSIFRIFECRAKLVRNLNSSKLSTKTRQINLLAIFAGYRDMYSFFCLNRFDISSSSPPQPQNMFEKPLTWRNWSTVMAETPPNMSS